MSRVPEYEQVIDAGIASEDHEGGGGGYCAFVKHSADRLAILNLKLPV